MKKSLNKIILLVVIMFVCLQHICYAYVKKPDILLSCLSILETVLFLCLVVIGIIIFAYTKIAKKEKAKDILESIFHVVGLLFLISATLLSFKLKQIWDIILFLPLLIIYSAAFLLRKKTILMVICVSIIFLTSIVFIIDILKPIPPNNELISPQPASVTALKMSEL